MGPTELLMQEHEVIAKALAILRNMGEALERGEPVPSDSAGRLVDFFVTYADQHHHAKEETLLFPALVEAGLPAEHGPVGVMLHEHEIGRSLVRRLRQAALGLDRSSAARTEFSESARQYFDLLGNHIHKENGILFRLADQTLSPEEMDGIEEAFANLDQEAAASGRNLPHLRAVEELGRIFLDGPSSGEWLGDAET